jgi:hypothetical protein
MTIARGLFGQTLGGKIEFQGDRENWKRPLFSMMLSGIVQFLPSNLNLLNSVFINQNSVFFNQKRETIFFYFYIFKKGHSTPNRQTLPRSN